MLCRLVTGALSAAAPRCFHVLPQHPPSHRAALEQLHLCTIIPNPTALETRLCPFSSRGSWDRSVGAQADGVWTQSPASAAGLAGAEWRGLKCPQCSGGPQPASWSRAPGAGTKVSEHVNTGNQGLQLPMSPGHQGLEDPVPPQVTAFLPGGRQVWAGRHCCPPSQGLCGDFWGPKRLVRNTAQD